MGFVMDCVRDSIPLWENSMRGTFLRQLEDETLPEECFAGYLVDDSIYLREYARVFAAGMMKAKTLSEIQTYYSFLAFINEGEGTTRVKYLHSMGITDEILETIPQRPENRAYTQFMLRATQEGTTGAECMMAGLPCMLSYAWIFHKILDRSPQMLQGRFGPLMRDYVTDKCDGCCVRWSEFANRLCRDLTEEEKQHCMAIFRQSSLHETSFWEMSAAPRDDLHLYIR